MDDHERAQAVAGLINQLARSSFVFRMAWPMRLSSKSARTRVLNASAEVDRIVREYVRSTES